jgi:saccharopine dehydrogenase-like NADP-dependent oxidoreductase
MKVVVLGGLGIQGRAALADLASSSSVEAIICADLDLTGFDSKTGFFNTSKVTSVKLDASSKTELKTFLQEGADIIIDLLPRQFTDSVCRAAIEAGKPDQFFDNPQTDRAALFISKILTH